MDEETSIKLGALSQLRLLTTNQNHMDRCVEEEAADEGVHSDSFIFTTSSQISDIPSLERKVQLKPSWKIKIKLTILTVSFFLVYYYYYYYYCYYTISKKVETDFLIPFDIQLK